MPAISVDEVLGVAKANKVDALYPQKEGGINSGDRHLLGKIYDKLTNNDTLGREFNLKSEGSLHHAKTMKRLLTKKEMDLLKRLASPAGGLIIEQE